MSVNQKMFEYLTTNHNDLFTKDLTEKLNVNELLFKLFENEILTTDKKATIRKQKAKYLKELENVSPGIIPSLETSPGTIEIVEYPQSELEHIPPVIIPSLQDTRVHDLYELFHKQQSELNSIKETLSLLQSNKQNSIVSNEIETIQVNSLIEKIKNYDMKNADRQTFYVTDVNSQLINDFYKSNQINKSSLLNFIISSWFENNVNNNVNLSEPEGITEPTKPKQLF